MSKRKDERQFKVRQLLQEHPKIKISDLSDYFQISSETIRKDIIELENSKIIKKEHGYALLRNWKQAVNQSVVILTSY